MTINSSFGHRFGSVFGMFQLGGQMPPYGSLSFNGNNYLSIAGNTGTAMGTDDFTWECWVYPTSSSNYQAFIDTRTNPLSGGDTTGFYFGTNDGSLNPIYYTNGLQLASTIAMTLNVWNHVALTRSNNTVTLWVNGVSGGNKVDSTNLTEQRVFVGGVGVGSGLNLTGYISNVRIVKGNSVYQKLYSLAANSFNLGDIKITVNDVGDVYLQFYNSHTNISDQLTFGTKVILDWDGRSPNTVANIAGPLIDFPGNPYSPGHPGFLLLIESTTELPGNGENYNIEAIRFPTLSFNSPIMPLTAITGTQLLLNTTYDNNFLVDSSVNQFAITNNTNVTSSNFEPFTPNPPV